MLSFSGPRTDSDGLAEEDLELLRCLRGREYSQFWGIRLLARGYYKVSTAVLRSRLKSKGLRLQSNRCTLEAVAKFMRSKHGGELWKQECCSLPNVPVKLQPSFCRASMPVSSLTTSAEASGTSMKMPQGNPANTSANSE